MEIASEEPIPALLDGETFTLGRQVSIELVANAFQALKPVTEGD